jgi:hypothetical protein
MRLRPYSSTFSASHPTRVILRPFFGGRFIPLSSVESVAEIASWVRRIGGGAFAWLPKGCALWITPSHEAFWVEEVRDRPNDSD